MLFILSPEKPSKPTAKHCASTNYARVRSLALHTAVVMRALAVDTATTPAPLAAVITLSADAGESIHGFVVNSFGSDLCRRAKGSVSGKVKATLPAFGVNQLR